MIIISVYIFCFGLIIGSFLNALIWRLHSGDSMMTRSMCPRCQHQLAWYDNIPLLSFVLLRGKCRYCGTGISWQYPAVELVVGILFLLVFQQAASYFFLPSIFLALLKGWFVVAVMVLIFVYDLRWYLILDKVTLPAGIVLFGFWLAEKSQQADLLASHNPWLELLIAIAIGYGFFAVQYYGSKGKWLGGGDVKLGLVMALALATPNRIMAAIFLAYILGAATGLILIASGKKDLGSKLPFGTFLAVATVAVLLYGEPLITWYLQLIGF
jgi:prepilin signal peptidase PulO-like enzyme (type II secretory pathway)